VGRKRREDIHPTTTKTKGEKKKEVNGRGG
jgi:hypothetical protein